MFTRTPRLRRRGGGQIHVLVTLGRLLLAFVLSSLIFCPLSRSQEAEPSVSKEYQLKAALLYSFTKYIDWPANRFPTPESPIIIGILGKNPFGEELEKVVEGRKLNGRAFLVKPIYSSKDISSVHVLFVSAGEEPRVVGDSMDLIQAPGVLTVGETEQFTVLGGIITFVTAGDKVHFEVSRESAQRGGVNVSPQLIKLSSHGRKKI